MKAQPTHLYAGLIGGYMPNVAEHYGTRGSALEALADYRERVQGYDGQPTAGRTADGFFQFAPSEVVTDEDGGPVYFELAYLEPCDTPDACELELEQQSEGW